MARCATYLGQNAENWKSILRARVRAGLLGGVRIWPMNPTPCPVSLTPWATFVLYRRRSVNLAPRNPFFSYGTLSDMCDGRRIISAGWDAVCK
jgi:hypothetical protein